MTTTIHMQVEQARQVAELLRRRVDYIYDLIRLQRSALSRLRVGWDSPAARHYFGDFDRILEQLDTQSHSIAALLSRLTREIDEWEYIDHSFGEPGSSPQFLESFAWIQQRLDLMAKRAMDFWNLLEGRKLLTEKWRKMSIEEREAWLREQHAAIAAKFGIPEVDVKYENIKALGVYHPSANNGDDYIVIDTDVLQGGDPAKALNTMIHESRHKMQVYWISNPEERPEGISEAQLEMWKSNYQDYVQPEKDPFGYWNQPIEKDAREIGGSYANEYLLGLAS